MWFLFNDRSHCIKKENKTSGIIGCVTLFYFNMTSQNKQKDVLLLFNNWFCRRKIWGLFKTFRTENSRWPWHEKLEKCVVRSKWVSFELKSSLGMFLLFDLTMTNNATVVKHDVKEIYNHVNSKHIFINFLFSEIETYKIQSGFSRKECFLYIHIYVATKIPIDPESLIFRHANHSMYKIYILFHFLY